LQIISVVTAKQLQRIFEKRTNFDLRRLLDESFLRSLIKRLQVDLAMTTASLSTLRLDSSLRNRAADVLVPNSKIKDILYVVLLADDKVITLGRPKKHSIHPADLHILLNTVSSQSIFSNPASWIPICLPKFNPSGFLHAYVTYVRPESRLGLALVSGGGGDEFEKVRSWCDTIVQKLDEDGTFDAIAESIRVSEYSVSDMGIPGLRHFVYKSRQHVQITSPKWEEPYNDINERRRLITLYQLIHDAIHAKSGQEAPLKLQYVRTENESVMGWITQPFELYIALSPRLPKSAAVSTANSLARWIKKEESRLFLRDAPVF